MAAPDKHPRPRIMVMLGNLESDRAALEALSVLAGSSPADILGMFVEDIDLLMLAELPIAREYCLLTDVERPLQTPDIERLFRIQARAAQQALAEIARRFGSSLSFRTARGAATALLREALVEADLMLFGAVRRSLRLPGSPSRGYAARAARQPVTVVFDGSDAARHALQLAVQLAGDAALPLIVLLRAGSAEELSGLNDEASRLAGTRPARLGEMVNPAWQELLAQVRRHRSSLLVVATSDELLLEENLMRLRNELNCPVVLVK
jgi:nucleotide-binding universal stress UspA family protein